MYTTVRVIALNDDSTVTVGCSTEACDCCKAKMFCNNRNENIFIALNSNNLDLKKGDTVELYLPPKKTISSTLLVFALPLCLFPAGYLISVKLLCSNEITGALAGLLFMALAFGIASIISIKNKKALMPIVNRKLQ